MPSLQNWLKRLVETEAEQFRATVSAQGGTPTTDFKVAELIGFGDDYFNSEWWVQITKAGGVAPEGQWRMVKAIGGYVSNTGLFTMDTAFGADVDVGDEMVFMHEYQYGVGARDDTPLATDTHDSGDESLISLNRGEIDRIGNLNDVADYTYNATDNTLVTLSKGILGSRVIAEGTFTTSSAAQPIDTSRTEADNWFNGCILMPVAGDRAFQTRLIVDYNGATDTFIIDPEHPFTGTTGTVAYVVIANEGDLIPATDSAEDLTTAHVVGAKADTASYTAVTTDSVISYLKGLLGSQVVATGTFDTSSDTVPADAAGQGAKANNWFNGCVLIPLTGAVALQPRRIVDFTTATGVFTIDPNNPFTVATGLVTYVIVADQTEFVPTTDAPLNRTPADVIGNKTDTADLTADTKSIVNLLRGLAVSLGVGHAAAGQWEDDGVPDLWDDIVTGITLRNTANRDGALHEKLYSLVSALQIVDAAGTGFEEDGTGATLYKTLIAFEGVTDAAGDVTSIIDAGGLGGYAADYWNGSLVVMLSGGAAGTVRTIVDFDGASDLTVEPAMPAASGNVSDYVILTQKCADWMIGANNANNEFASNLVAANSDGSVLERLEDLLVKATGTTGIFHEQADTAVTINAVAGSETNVLNLVVADTRYIVRGLRLKSVNPNPDTVTVRLYELINDVFTVVDTFTITNLNFGTHFTTMDMFGIPYLVGDNLKVTVQSSAGTYAIVGQYSSAKNNV